MLAEEYLSEPEMGSSQHQHTSNKARNNGTFPTVELEKRRFLLTFCIPVAILIAGLQDQICIREISIMEDKKKTFGAYILQRRKELGMTQKGFAEKLFVTESAVSKWERGLSYPDITLLGTICEVLGVTEHELLTGSEDTRQRSAERLAGKYLRLLCRRRRAQYALYGLILLGCLIGSLASGNAAVIFIALPSVMMAASLTLLPVLATEHPVFGRCRVALAIGGFTASLELLLLIVGVLGREQWLPTAMIAVLFGMTLVFLPFLMGQIPFPAWMERRRASAYLLFETALLLALLLTCCVQTGGDWFPVAAVSVIFGLGFLILPVLLRQLPLPEWPRGHRLLVYFAVQTALLFVLLLVVELCGGQMRLLARDIPVAGLCLLLPWGVMLIARYLPVSGWYRGELSVLWAAVWTWLAPFGLGRLMDVYYGYGSMEFGPLSIPFDFRATNPLTRGWNIFVIVLLVMTGIAAALCAVGWIRRARRK